MRVPLQTRHRKHAERDDHQTPRGFGAPSRKVELYSELLAEAGYPPLPEFEEPRSSPRSRPDLAERSPLILSCAKSRWFCETQHRNLPSLRRSAPDPPIEIHPDTARARGIGSGDWVRIDTPQGSVRARAKLNANLDPQVVYGQHGWCNPATSSASPATRRSARTAPTSTCAAPTAQRPDQRQLAPARLNLRHRPPGAADEAGVVTNRTTAPRQADDRTRPTS